MIELLKLGLPIVVDSDGQTALHLAASAGHLEMVEALIQAGCDVGIQDFVSRHSFSQLWSTVLRSSKGFTYRLRQLVIVESRNIGKSFFEELRTHKTQSVSWSDR